LYIPLPDASTVLLGTRFAIACGVAASSHCVLPRNSVPVICAPVEVPSTRSPTPFIDAITFCVSVGCALRTSTPNASVSPP
jgi:hypothetical protein